MLDWGKLLDSADDIKRLIVYSSVRSIFPCPLIVTCLAESILTIFVVFSVPLLSINVAESPNLKKWSTFNVILFYDYKRISCHNI